MLPFLKNKKDAGLSQGVIVKTRESDNPEENQDFKDPAMEIHDCMKTFLSCVDSKDSQGMAEALYDAHEIMHGRGEKEEKSSPHTYEDQKEE